MYVGLSFSLICYLGHYGRNTAVPSLIFRFIKGQKKKCCSTYTVLKIIIFFLFFLYRAVSIVSKNLSHLTFFSDSHPRVTYFFISATKWKFDVCTYFPLWDVKNCTITSAYVSGFTVNINFMNLLSTLFTYVNSVFPWMTH